MDYLRIGADVMSGASAAAMLASVSSGYTPPTTSYANAGGTGDRTATITASVTGFQSLGGGTASNLVDGAFATNTTDACYHAAASGVTNGGFTFDFGVGAAKYIDEFKWYQNATAALGTCVFEGSNDNSSYTTLGSSFTLNDAGSGSGTTFSTPHSVPAPYRYYRIRQTSGSSTNNPYFKEIEFKIG